MRPIVPSTILRVALLAAIAAAWFAAPAADAQVPLPSPTTTEPAAAPVDETSVADALRLLAIVLDDPEARAALVDQLRAAEPLAAADPAAPGAPPAEEVPPTIPQLIAEQTMEVVEDVSDGVVDVLRSLVDIRAFIGNARAFDFGAVSDQLLALALTLAVTLLAYWATRWLARPILRRLEAGAETASFGPRQLLKVVAAAVETLAVALAWSIGFGASLVSLEPGVIIRAQGLFLYAFLIAELVRVAIRVFFRPHYHRLRLTVIDEPMARHWNFWLARIAGVLGYGLIFVVPLVRPEASPGFADWLELLIASLAYVMAVTLVLRNRRRVRRALVERVARLPEDAIASGLGALARVWHIIAIGYVTGILVVWRAHPGNAEAFLLQATGYSAVAIILGSFVIALLTRRIAGGIMLNDRVKRKLPLLEARLNSFVPTTLKVARFVVAGLILATILTAWDVVDLPGWAASETGQSILYSLGWVATILLLAGVAWIVVSSWVEYRLNPNLGRQPTARERTLLALFSNAFVIVLLVITGMSVLNELGINVAPLIAGAGVVGLAIGFGSQKLVQDIINGAFIQFENTMNEGDVVTAGPITGVVEKLTIRSVSLRDVNGRYHMIPFSGVDNVTNFTKTFSFHVADVGVAYRESIADVKTAMIDAFDRLMQTEHRANILPPFEMFGVEAFADSAVIVRGRIKTLPGQQWSVGRAYNEVIKEVFDERGIEMPFPHRTLYIGEDKQGDSPALNLRHLRAARRPAPAKHQPPPGASVTPPSPEIVPPSSEDAR
jgi:moderate conductance mechanosensitive channel